MENKKEKYNVKANVIYKAALDEEKEWLKENKYSSDIIVLKQLLYEIRQLGYKYKYFVDITNRENNDIELLNLLSTYVGKFQDEYFSAAIVNVIGKKGNIVFTETILNHYNSLSNNNKRMYGAFYDNALSRIKDKRFLSDYIELLKSTEDAMCLPLTMVMLGKWKLEGAKKHFLEYLIRYKFYLNGLQNRNLIFISLDALSYYPDIDGEIMKAFKDKLNCADDDLQRATQKAIQKLEKSNQKNQAQSD